MPSCILPDFRKRTFCELERENRYSEGNQKGKLDRKNRENNLEKRGNSFGVRETERRAEGKKERREKEERRKPRSPLCFSALLFVPEIGIEPIHPCGRQILSLLRLPIPPPGQRVGSLESRVRSQERLDLPTT